MFFQLKMAGQVRKRWLLVNLQDSKQFASQVLNRDVWSHEGVRAIVSEHFLLWQVRTYIHTATCINICICTGLYIFVFTCMLTCPPSTCDVLLVNDPRLNTDTDWDMSRKKGFRASIIVWGVPRDASTLEVWGKLADVGLVGFARGSVMLEGDHIRLVLARKGLSTNEIVSRISACLRKIGCRCVLDEKRDVANQKPVKLQYVNLCLQMWIVHWNYR